MNNKKSTTDISKKMINMSFRNAMILGIFAVVSTGLIAITNSLTKDKINKEIERSLVRKLSLIVADDKYNNEVYLDCIKVNDQTLLGTTKDQKIYRMRNNGIDYATMITTTAPEGYSGKIKLAIATDVQGKIIGVSVLQHKETPGLGDKIERQKSDWLDQFDGKTLSSFTDKQWKVKKDGGEFDALTGATITPRAVVKAIHNTLLYLNREKSSIFSKANDCKIQTNE